MNNRLINILVDFAFKKVFAGSGEQSKRILKDFLNAILELKGEERISEIVYLNPFNDREFMADKQSIMDIKVKIETGELIDIEVQISDVDDYRKRSLYYWSKLYGETIQSGESYYNLKKSIVINILDFNLISENNKYHNVFQIKERDDNFTLIEDLEIHYIELSKFESKDIDNLNDIEAWITFLKECSQNGDSEVIKELSSRKEEFSTVMAIMEQLSADEIEYQRYLAREKYLMDERSRKQYAERKDREFKKMKLEMEKTKLEMEKTKLEIEKTKLEIKKNKRDIEDRNKELEDRNRDLENRDKELENRDKELELKNNNTKKAIINLMKKGFESGEIASILNISKDEVDSIIKK